MQPYMSSGRFRLRRLRARCCLIHTLLPTCSTHSDPTSTRPASATMGGQYWLTGITADGARSVIAMTNGAEHQRVRCASHGIQLALSCAASNAEFQAFMAPVSRINAQRRGALARELKRIGRPVLMPIYPARTRWNSHYDALRRFVDIEPALKGLAPRDTTRRHSTSSWRRLDPRAPLRRLCLKPSSTL